MTDDLRTMSACQLAVIVLRCAADLCETGRSRSPLADIREGKFTLGVRRQLRIEAVVCALDWWEIPGSWSEFEVDHALRRQSYLLAAARLEAALAAGCEVWPLPAHALSNALRQADELLRSNRRRGRRT